MDENEGGIKRKNRLAVFEHITKKKKTSKKRKLANRAESEDSSPSETELVIDDEPNRVVRKTRKPLVKLTEEPLSLHCNWNDCVDDAYNSWEKFNSHLSEHAANQSGDKIVCEWEGCYNAEFETIPLLMQHLSYHGYITKLKNIGENVVHRNKLPSCSGNRDNKVPINNYGYKCEWENCCFVFCTIFEFFNHMEVHIKNNPKVAAPGDCIECCWKDCNTKYSNQTKLAEHLRTHTKEKVIACPNCEKLFSNKTKFSDHRKRQLSSELQTYQCSQCLKLFPSERLLRDHMRAHVNHYKCTMCDMTCPKPSILAKHIRFKHINFKPFKCSECDKTFVEKHNLNTHLKTHDIEYPWVCSKCGFKCRSRAGLDNHYFKKHDSPRLEYQCHCCKKKFKKGSYLTKHLTKQHNYHWPSGHSRFRYRKDQDGIYRLQTVRYESLEVTQEMIRSASVQTKQIKKTVNYNLKYDNDGKSGYVLSISENCDQSVKHSAKNEEQNNVLITINDLDEQGNILNCEVLQSTVLHTNELPDLGTVVPIKEEHDLNQNSNQLSNRRLSSDNENEEKKYNTLQTATKDVTILDYKMFKDT